MAFMPRLHTVLGRAATEAKYADAREEKPGWWVADLTPNAGDAEPEGSEGSSDMDGPVVWADFNGVFGDLLCLTHDDSAPDEHGNRVALREGMRLLAFDYDADAE